MVKEGYGRRQLVALGLWAIVALVCLGASRLLPSLGMLRSGLSILQLLSLLAGIMAGATVVALATHWRLLRSGKPAAEGIMVGRLYRLVAIVAAIMTIAYGMGQLSAFGQFFSLFGGLILG